MDTGEIIKWYRQRKGMTQGELAKAVGSTTAAISRYELNQREARYSLLKAMADVLDAPEEEFLKDYPKEPLKIDDYKERLSGIENMLESAGRQTEPEARLEALRQAQVAFAQLLAEERFALKIAGETRHKETELIVTRKDSMQGRLIAAFSRLKDEAKEKAVGRVEELGMVPEYRHASLPNSLRQYLFAKYGLMYELDGDAEIQETYEAGNGDTLQATARHIALKWKDDGNVKYWHFYYYDSRLSTPFMKEVISKHGPAVDRPGKASFVFDNDDAYDEFYVCYEEQDYSPLLYFDVDGDGSYVEGSECHIGYDGTDILFLIDKETWEIKHVSSF